MTSRERFLNSLLGGPVDRLFRYEHGYWPSTRQRWIGEGYPPDADFFQYFQMDPLIRFTINSGYTDSPYYPPLPEEVLEETDKHVIFRDNQGIVKKNLKANFDTSMPQFLKFPVANRMDWSVMVRFLNPADNISRIGDVESLKHLTADPDIPTLLPICGAFGHPRNLFGDEELCFVMYDDPNLLHEILDNWCELYVDLIRRLTSSVRVDSLLIWEDMCYKNGPLISPSHFREFLLPRYKSLIEACRVFGVRAILVDTDGDCLSLIPLFLEAGVDAIFPFEVQAGMDVTAIRRQFGSSFGIIGGIDKRALAKDKQAIEREVNRVVPFFRESGRFIPTLDHTIPIDVPLNHFNYYLECVRRYE
jgi:uroporphyrinogen decarboxylase